MRTPVVCIGEDDRHLALRISFDDAFVNLSEPLRWIQKSIVHELTANVP